MGQQRQDMHDCWLGILETAEIKSFYEWHNNKKITQLKYMMKSMWL